MNYATQGAEALAASDAPTAVTAYTKALIEHPTSPDYFTQRATAFTRLKPARHDLALRDAEFSVLLAQKRAKRDKIQAAQHRRVVSLYGTGRYSDAKFILQTMEKWRPKGDKKAKMEGDMWAARIDTKLKSVPEEEQLVTAIEYPELDLPGERQMKALLTAQLKADGSYRFDDDTVAEGSTEEAASETSKQVEVGGGPAGAISVPSASTTVPLQSKIRHEWYQNAQNVIVTIYAKGIKKNEAEADIQNDSVFISFPHPVSPDSNFTFSLDPLFALIDPISSKCTIMSTKIEITLKKAAAGQKWPSLEGTEPLKTTDNGTDTAAKAAVMASLRQPEVSKPATAPSYPTSSRTGPKNWDKLATDLTAKKTGAKTGGADKEGDAEDEDSDFGGDPVDGFFKKLYAGADDDTKRAMMKSFQESNGTSLSTNWADVGKKRVEPVESDND